MLRPMDFPPASAAPRLAASMIPGPPPEQMTNLRGLSPSDMAQDVMIRAEPNITMVSPTFSRRRRSSGSMYSVRIRTGRAGKLSINTASRYGGSISTLLCLLRGRRLMKPPLQKGCGHYLFTLNPEGEPAKISCGSSFYAPAASKRQQHGLILCGVCTGELPADGQRA